MIDKRAMAIAKGHAGTPYVLIVVVGCVAYAIPAVVLRFRS
jgi:hypothetical protein